MGTRRSYTGSALRAAAGALCFLAGLLAPAFWTCEGISSAHAQSAGSEKDAFDAAKSLGTVEAWDAFLSHYPTGFHADLARAYVKKLAEQPPPVGSPQTAPPQPAAQPVYDYPMVAGTWGGIVRSRPGQENSKVASLKEGEEVTLMGPGIPVSAGDYPWFKIAFRDGDTGYMWGGLLCSTGAERADIFKLCTFTPYRASSADAAAPQQRPKRKSSNNGRPSWCRSPSQPAEQAICDSDELLSLDSVLNVAYQRAKFDSPQSRGEIENEQRRWLGRRNLCGYDANCVRSRYNEQIPFLEGFFGN